MGSAILNTAKTGTFTCQGCGRTEQVQPGKCPAGWLLGVFDPSVHCSQACLDATLKAGK